MSSTHRCHCNCGNLRTVDAPQPVNCGGTVFNLCGQTPWFILQLPLVQGSVALGSPAAKPYHASLLWWGCLTCVAKQPRFILHAIGQWCVVGNPRLTRSQHLKVHGVDMSGKRNKTGVHVHDGIQCKHHFGPTRLSHSPLLRHTCRFGPLETADGTRSIQAGAPPVARRMYVDHRP